MVDALHVIVGRHGHKPEREGPLEKTSLTEQDRKVWQSSCALLDVFKHMPVGEHANPGLELRNVPLIREKMQTFYTDLPDSATIVFTSTPYERAFMTAALEYGCLEQIVAADGKKDIRFASLMPMSDALSEEHGRNIPDINAVAEKLVGMMPKFGIPESYLEGAGGHRITNENDIVRTIMEHDLFVFDEKMGAFKCSADGKRSPNPDSCIRKARNNMKAQLRHLRDEVLRDIRGPIYLVIGGHHSNVVVSQLLLDALAGVADGEEELVIPEPLDTATIPSHVIQGL